MNRSAELPLGAVRTAGIVLLLLNSGRDSTCASGDILRRGFDFRDEHLDFPFDPFHRCL